MGHSGFVVRIRLDDDNEKRLEKWRKEHEREHGVKLSIANAANAIIKIGLATEWLQPNKKA